ncbi:MAG: acyltransferase [Novosphingobium sp.]
MVFNYSTEAVVLFFILSGVVISLNHEQDVGSGKNVALRYSVKRIVRIYPIYLVALIAGALVVPIAKGNSVRWTEFFGNLVFLQSLGGAIVSPPEENMALWSLANEMTYYACFFVVLLFPAFRRIWWAVAILAALLSGRIALIGVANHVVWIFSLAPAWLLGGEIVRRADRLPKVTPGFGLCSLAIGLIYARCPMTSDFYDSFRLLSFALFSAPLFLAIVQPPAESRNYRAARIAAWLLGASLLWSISHAILATKLVLSVVGLIAAVAPVGPIDGMLKRAAPLARPFVWIGSISYALYAIHMPILFLLMRFPLPWPARALAFLVLSLGAATVLERVMQPALSRAIRPLLGSVPTVAVAA